MPEGSHPEKVKEIADAIRRDNPGISDEKAYKMAWATYEKMGKGKDYAGMGSGYGGPGGHGIHYPAESGILLTKKHRNDNEISLGPYSYLSETIEEVLSPQSHSATLRDDIVRFFTDNPYPNDTQVHSYATEMGLTYQDLEKEIYALLTELIQSSGLNEFS